MDNKKVTTVLKYALTGYALCFATKAMGMAMAIGLVVTTMQTALIVYAIGAPIFFAVISWEYFRKFNYTAPLQTALIFVGIVIIVDFFVWRRRIPEMFASPFETWIPFALIFTSTYLTGLFVSKKRAAQG